MQPPHAAQAPSPPQPPHPGARGGRGARLTGAGAVALVADPAQPVEALAQAAQPVLQLRVPAAQRLLAHAAPVHRADGVLLRVCGAGGTAAAGRPFPGHTAALREGTRPPPASTRPRCATEVTPGKLRAPLREGQPTALKPVPRLVSLPVTAPAPTGTRGRAPSAALSVPSMASYSRTFSLWC